MVVVTNAAPSLERLPLGVRQTRAVNSEERRFERPRKEIQFGGQVKVRRMLQEEIWSPLEPTIRWTERSVSQVFIHCTSWLKKESLC